MGTKNVIHILWTLLERALEVKMENVTTGNSYEKKQKKTMSEDF